VQEALLGLASGPFYDRLARWLRNGAEASRKRRITREEELPSGRYMVCEEWPSRAAYLEFTRYRMTLEAMLYTEELSEEEGGEP
jgi:hypothetical protein